MLLVNTLRKHKISTVLHYGFFTHHNERESIFKELKQMLKLKILKKNYFNVLPLIPNMFSVQFSNLVLFSFKDLLLCFQQYHQNVQPCPPFSKAYLHLRILRLLSTWVSCCYLKFDMFKNDLILYIKTVHWADILVLLIIPPFSQPQRTRILKPCSILSLSLLKVSCLFLFIPIPIDTFWVQILIINSQTTVGNSLLVFLPSLPPSLGQYCTPLTFFIP